MSATSTVEFRRRGIWAYDVSLSILLAEVVDILDQSPGPIPTEFMEHLRLTAVDTDVGLIIDDTFSEEECDLLLSALSKATDRLAERRVITAQEAADWFVLDGHTVVWRGATFVDTAPIIQLGNAVIQLMTGGLPSEPAGTWWCYGFPDGPRAVPMRFDLLAELERRDD